MKMSDRRAASAAKLKALVPTPAATTKPRMRVYAGAIITEAMVKAALGLAKLMTWATSSGTDHVVGGTCPHCKGTGRYTLHTRPGEHNKCYRCDGKGRLSERDMKFFANRVVNSRPVCWEVTA